MEIGDLCTYAPKSSIKAGDAIIDGRYMFFTSSSDENKRYSDYQLDCEGIIMGTGGNATLHYYNGKFATSTDCVVLLSNETIRCKYLYYFFLSNMDILESGFKGAGLKHTNKNYINSINISSVPSFEMQDRVIKVLDKVQAIIDKRKRQLKKLDELVKSRFIEMFGDPEENTFCWKEQPLSEHLSVIGGYAFKSDQFSKGGIPVLKIGNINSGIFKPVNLVYWEDDDTLSRYKMYPGDLVMSLTGTVGKDDYGNVCILGNDYDVYYLNQRNAKLKLCDTLNKYYLSMLLKFEPIKKKLTGVSRGVRQANISNKDILNLIVPIPQIGLQEQFAAFIEQTDKSKFEIKQSLEKLELLKKALMQKYFR